MSKWIHTTLNDICRSDKGAIISGPFGSNISSKFFVLDGVPVIRGNNLSLSLDKFYDDDFVFVTEEKADELNCYAEEGDLIFTAAGTIGQVGILEAPLKYKKYVISNKQLRARIDTRKVDLLYAYYWFASAWMQNYFIRNNKGSTVPLITLSELKDAPISYPEDITEQKKIAMAIEAISRKINNNRNICFNLESMAKTLYDYWFTQFDFPNAEGKPYCSSGGEMVWNDQLKRKIPKGWSAGQLSDIANITMGQSPSGDTYNENGSGTIFYQGCTDFGTRFPVPRVYTSAPTRFAKAGDILMSVRAPVGTLNIAMEDCCIGRGLAALNSKFGSQLHLLYTLSGFKQLFDVMDGNGTTFGSITKDSDPNICLRYYVTSDLLYLLLRFLEHHIGNNNGNEAQYATRRLLDVVLLFDSNEDAEDFATYIHRHLGTFDSKVLEQREPYIANETDMAAKALAQEIRNSQALKEMQPEWELFRLENA